jgi:hypothetical protein
MDVQLSYMRTPWGFTLWSRGHTWDSVAPRDRRVTDLGNARGRWLLQQKRQRGAKSVSLDVLKAYPGGPEQE